MNEKMTHRGFSLKPTRDGVYDYYLMDREEAIRGFVDDRDGIMIERANGNVYRGETFEIALEALLAAEEI
jgi:hypothetical protein